MQEGWNPPRCTFLQPFTYVIFFPLLSPPTESSQCDNRGIISSGSRPCSCKVRTHSPLNLLKDISEQFAPFFFRSAVDYAEMPERVLIHVRLVSLAQNNVAGALCDECKAGFFHLSEGNPEGCLQCFCMGVTRQCSSSSWSRDQARFSGMNAS